MEMITLKCPECKGVLQVDEDHMLMKCPYCGCEELIIEDKEITLKRLDIKKKKLEMEDDERKYQRSKEENEDFTIKEWLNLILPVALSMIGFLLFMGLIFFFIKVFNLGA